MLIRINDILNEPICNNSGTLKIDHIEEVGFENVDYRYSSNSSEVLSNIHFKIKDRETVAFVGASGSGKSTLIKLLVGLINPTSGNIKLNDIDINEYDNLNLRRLIGIVSQDITLFNKSIVDNLNICNENISQDEIIDALEISCIRGEIEDMPMKLNTFITEYGQNISGGQRQRIGIARAILHRPKLLILDEASSSLDSVTEAKINKNLEKLNCTKIIIAHRLSTIKHADKIFVLNKGIIEESGTHDELISKNGVYKALYTKQERKKQERKLGL